jgi:hypothetical protein
MSESDTDRRTLQRDPSRYAIRGEEDGTWTVCEVATGLPVVFEEQMLVRLTFELAEVMFEHLNEMDAEAERLRQAESE